MPLLATRDFLILILEFCRFGFGFEFMDFGFDLILDLCGFGFMNFGFDFGFCFDVNVDGYF